MLQTPEIQVRAYYKNGKKVAERNEANIVSYSIKKGKMIDFVHLMKENYDGYISHPKPVKKWEDLPIEI